jgi:hypothetical protein
MTIMSNNTNDMDDFRDWRFEAPNREHMLERRVKELEDTVSRLEKELSRMKSRDFDAIAYRNEKTISGAGNKTIGALAGTISILPESPYKAD